VEQGHQAQFNVIEHHQQPGDPEPSQAECMIHSKAIDQWTINVNPKSGASGAP
jgi:hypothetical protein